MEKLRLRAQLSRGPQRGSRPRVRNSKCAKGPGDRLAGNLAILFVGLAALMPDTLFIWIVRKDMGVISGIWGGWSEPSQFLDTMRPGTEGLQAWKFSLLMVDSGFLRQR